MKEFEKPEVQVEHLEIMDVITTSPCNTEAVDCQYDLGE